jgi:hypothetical protein
MYVDEKRPQIKMHTRSGKRNYWLPKSSRGQVGVPTVPLERKFFCVPLQKNEEHDPPLTLGHINSIIY